MFYNFKPLSPSLEFFRPKGWNYTYGCEVLTDQAKSLKKKNKGISQRENKRQFKPIGDQTFQLRQEVFMDKYPKDPMKQARQ